MDKKTKKPKKTCRQALEEKGVLIFNTIDGEFVAYKPKLTDGHVNMDFPLTAALEGLDFFDYEEIALGRGCYVMGDVDSPV